MKERRSGMSTIKSTFIGFPLELLTICCSFFICCCKSLRQRVFSMVLSKIYDHNFFPFSLFFCPTDYVAVLVVNIVHLYMKHMRIENEKENR